MKKPVGKEVASAKRPARKSASRKSATKVAPAAAAAVTAAAAPPRPSKNLLSAGIKALSNVHEEAVARQSRVFESLLGIGAKRETPSTHDDPAATTLDPFGFKKFEDVFDQRVAKALQHLGVPTVDAFAELTAEVERLRETVARLEARLVRPVKR